MDAASIFLALVVAGSTVDSPPESVAAKRHTTYFAGQPGWGTDNSSPPPAAAPTGNRYQPSTTGSTITVGPPPGVVDRTQSAVITSGNALRDGVEAGIQDANQQLYQGSGQAIESARTSGQQFNDQFQIWAGNTAQRAGITAPATTGTAPTATTAGRQQVSNPFTTSTSVASTTSAAAPKARNGVAPPPWVGSGIETGSPPVEMAANGLPSATSNRTAVQTESGWTSVHSSVAPPSLAPPRLINTEAIASPFATTSANDTSLQPLVDDRGPNFPATISASQPTERSLIAQPQQPAAAAPAGESWGLGWDGKTGTQPTQGAAIGNRYDGATISSRADGTRDFGQPPAQPAAQLTASPTQGSQPPPTFGIGAFDNGWPENRAPNQAGSIVQREAGATAPAGGVMAPPPFGSATTVGMPQSAATPGMPASAIGQLAGTASTLPSPAGEQLPWMPLVVVSLALAGSIGANLFLGYSYADARFKYLSLVQKTASKFRRAAA